MLVLERAPEHLRGGNTYFTGGGFRFPYGGIDDIRALIPDLSDAEVRRHRRRRVSRGLDARRHDARVGGARRRRAGRPHRAARVPDGAVDAGCGRALGAAVRAAGVRVWRRAAILGRADHGGRRRREGAVRRAVRDRAEGGRRDPVRDAGDGAACAMRAGACRGVSVQSARRVRARSTPALSCWRAAASRRTRRCGRATSGRAGSWRRCAAPASTPATASAWRSTSARCRTGTGAAATPSPGTSTRRRSGTGASATCTRSTRTRSASSSTPTGAASSTRARTSATTRTRSTGARSSRSRSGWRTRSSTRR